MKLSEKKLSLKAVIFLTVLIPIVVIAASSIAIIITAKSVQPQETADASLSVRRNMPSEPFRKMKRMH